MESNRRQVRVLFVCLGNICRSPMAEAIFNHLLAASRISDYFYVESAGTSGHHKGEPYHRDTKGVLADHNIPISGTSRPVTSQDYEEFDYILAMDESNHSDLMASCPASKYEKKIKHILEFQQNEFVPGLNVPDPYYGGVDGFEHVYELLLDACMGLLNQIRNERNI